MSSIESLLWTYWLTGLSIGFGHCIGMCGPLVITFSLHMGGRSRIIPHLFYHTGRILTYMILGAIMGGTGSFTMVAADIRVFQVGVMYLAGGLIIAMGLAMGGWFPWLRLFDWNVAPDGALVCLFGRLSKSRSLLVYLPLGFILGLLPCGPVYTALLGAARAGMAVSSVYEGIFSGMALMVAFGAGTVPALLLVGKLAHTGWLKWRTLIDKVSAILMIGVGGYFIVMAVRF